MIRVLNVISDSNVGGAGRVLINYLCCADTRSFETLIAVPRGSLLKAPLEAAGGRVYEVDGLAGRSYHPSDVKTLEKLIGELAPDIVHTHGALSGRIAARRRGKAVIYTRHSVFPVPAKLRYPPGRWLNRLVSERYADHIIAVSPAAAKNLTDAGVPAEKITVILNGVAPVARIPEDERAALRASLGLAPGEFTAGIAARIEPYKGHLLIVEAAEKLRAEGRRFKVLVAGTGSYEDGLRREVERRGLSDTVLLLGFRGDVGALMSVFDVQLNASWGTEATSLALLEGMSMGVTSVVSDYGGNPWLVTDGDNGFVFPSGDSAALARALARAMDEPETLARMGARASEVFRERFTAETFAKNIENVYRKTWEEKRHGR